MKNSKTLALLTVLFATLFSSAALAGNAHVHETIAASTTNPPSEPDAHFSEDAWIYTKLDSTGYTQVYYQYLDGSETDPSAQLTEIALTTSSFNKSKAKWGPSVQFMNYYETDGDTSPDTCINGQLFYYLGDSNSDGNTEIWVTCFQGLNTSTATIVFNVQLTESTSATTFDVTDYDVSSSISTMIYYASKGYTNSIPVVFTADNSSSGGSSGELHFIMHSGNVIYGDSTNINGSSASPLEPPVVIDFDDFRSGTQLFKWGAANREATTGHPASYFIYSQPSFDAYGNNITFLRRNSDGTTENQVGVVWAAGTREMILTNLSLGQDITRPKFFGSMQDSSALESVKGLFFELEANSSTKGKLIMIPYGVTILGPSPLWCNVAYELDFVDTTHTRSNLATMKMTSGTYTDETLYVYQLEQNDGNHDLYQAHADLTTCPRGDGTVLISSIDYTLSLTETQITCQNDNTNPTILPNAFFDDSFSYGTSADGYTDVVFLRSNSDASGDLLGHAYNIGEETGECAGNCYETATGEAITDANGYLDTDGYADECEEVPCDLDVLAADIDGDGIGGDGDQDSDGIINREDNCPCNSNYNQLDSDGDGVGDDNWSVWPVENGCDNCPGVSNPQTSDMDMNGDGVIGLATDTPIAYMGGFLDGNVRQTDTDGDGYGDVCDDENDECGLPDHDRDADGIGDYCDNCVNIYNPSQTDLNGDDIGDVCVTIVTETETVADPCGNGTGEYTYDSDGDGTKDRCDNVCGESNGRYSFDSNDDGLYDSCYPCQDGTVGYQFDTDNDGVNDSCVQAEIAPIPNEVELDPSGFWFTGNKLGCSLNAFAPLTDSSSVLWTMLTGLIPLIAMRIRKK